MQLSEQQTTKVVCIWDPAIDAETSDYAEYIRTRELKHLQFRAGTAPEIYHLRPITPAMFAWVNAPELEYDKHARAFYAAVFEVSGFVNAEMLQQDKWAPALVQNAGTKLDTHVDLFKKDERELFSPATVNEIGEVAYRRAFFPKRMPVSYRLSPLSLQTWQMVASLPSAEPAANSQTAGPSEPPPAEAAPATALTPAA